MPRRLGVVGGKRTLLTSTNHIIISSELAATTKGTTFILAEAFPFNKGEGEIFEIKATVFVETGAVGEIRLYDVTNAQIIASTTFSNVPRTVVSLGLASNLPVGDAVFEVQIRRSGGLNKFVSSEGLILEYPQ